MARQKLMTAALRKSIPALYSNEKKALGEVVVLAKFFHAYGRGTWWVTEFDGEDLMYGAVDLGMTDAPEWGYISLSELESIQAFRGVQAIERDSSWRPTKWSEIRKVA